MTNKSGNLGTAAETAVVKVLRENGWPHAERRRLHGAVDLGDITGTPGIVWEVKGGDAAKNASDGQIDKWLEETERERKNAEANIGILVVQRKGIGYPNADQWWAIVPAWVIVRPVDADHFPVRLKLADMCHLLRDWGYGTELEEAA